MRYSKPRELILNQVQTRSDHPTANAIYAALREVCPGLSLGTVYRNLNCLVDAGSIRRVEVPGHADHFDHTLPPHCHLYCRCCGEVTDVAVDQAALEQIFSEVPARIESFSVTLIGVCPTCMAQNAEPAQFE